MNQQWKLKKPSSFAEIKHLKNEPSASAPTMSVVVPPSQVDNFMEGTVRVLLMVSNLETSHGPDRNFAKPQPGH